jgi:tetratricopeptide (TPR) repeat protein
MRFRVALIAFLAVGLAGCTRNGEPKKTIEPAVALAPPGPAIPPAPAQPAPVPADVPPPFVAAVDPNTEKYDAAVTQALTALADQKLADALAAFETARGLGDNDFVRGEIEKLKARIDQQNVADKTVAEIRGVLDAGKAADASKLATQALGEFGDRGASPDLLDLRVQADALQSVQAKEDDAARFARLSADGLAALDRQNYRAAADSLGQALAIKQDPALADKVRELRDRLDRYDSFRKQAADLRRDPAQLEQAADLYREAAKAWDTPQVAQDIDDCMLALEHRRDTLAIFSFESAGDVGADGAGRTIAEELLPQFKQRFDLVDSGRLSQAIADLKLDGPLADPTQQRAVADLAKARYLVFGSVRRLGPIFVHARLVDTRTGLIVQTGQISADKIEDIVPLLPDLARQLLMTDDEKLAYDQQHLQATKRIEPVDEGAPLPPPPAPNDPPPPFPVLAQAPPPDVGAVEIAQLQALPPPPAVPPPVIVVAEPPPPVFRHRMLFASLQLGDALFRAGQIAAAQRHYEFALTLAPADFAIRARLDRCRALLPPVFVQPIVVPPPRIAFVNFKVIGNPRIVPPILSTWVPQALAPYFRPQYEVVEPGEVYWMMANLGMTMTDVVNDPNARRWLGRALNVQAFVLGAVEESASFNVSTYLVDAEHGYLQGWARIHVRNPFELRLRLGELAQVTMMPAAQASAYLAQQNQFDVLLGRGRDGLGRGDLVVSIAALEDALRLRPSDVQVLILLNQARSAQRRRELEALRRQDYVRREALAQAARERQWELARQAEAMRVAAPAPAISIADQRVAAYADLTGRAQLAVKAGNFGLAVSLYKGALDVAPSSGSRPLPIPQAALLVELGKARAEAERADRNKAGAEAALRQSREKELAAARAKLAADETRLHAVQLAQIQANDAKYRAALSQGQALMGQGKYDAASAALQAAQHLKKTEQVDAMLALAVQRQAEQNLKTTADKTSFERQLAASHAQTKEADAAAKRNHDLYYQSLKQAQAALAAKKYDEAESQYKAAVKLFRTDIAVAGLNQAVALKAAETKAAATANEKAMRVGQLLAAAKTASAAGKYADAIVSRQQARTLDPTNADVLAALTQAEQARSRAQATAQTSKTLPPLVSTTPLPKTKIDAPKVDPAQQKTQAAFAAALDKGKKALDAKNYPVAIQALKQALDLQPMNRDVSQLYNQASAGQLAAQMVAQQAALRDAAYAQSLKAGQQHLTTKNYAAAIQAGQDALKQRPNDPQATQIVQQASAALNAGNSAQAAEQKKKSSFNEAVQNGQRLISQKKFAEALQSLQSANSLYPNDPTVAQLTQQANQGLRPTPTPVPTPTPMPKVDPTKKAADEKAKKEADDRAKVAKHLADGQNFLNGRRFPDAIREFEAALSVDPNNAQAKALLQKAKTSK